VEEKPGGGCQIKEGTEKDRLISVHDPEMRHGRKSASKTFNGHKPRWLWILESQLICGVEVLAGNAGDQEKALELVHQAERVMEAEGGRDGGRLCIWGRPDAESLCRRAAAADGLRCRPVTTAIVFPRARLRLIWIGWKSTVRRANHDGYESLGANCGSALCLRQARVRPVPYDRNASVAKGGRSISIQPRRTIATTRPAPITNRGRQKTLRQRVVVEHGIARLVRDWGFVKADIRKNKTRFQVVLAAVVANLSWSWVSVTASRTRREHNVDPVTQALSTPTDGRTTRQNGFLAEYLDCLGFDIQYFFIATRPVCLLANAALS